MTDRYWFDNSLSDEGTRLRLLEKIADPRSISLLNDLGVHPGSCCAKLGAGGGSIAAWLADRVGDLGSVVAVDRDLSLCRHLSARPNVCLLEGNLETLRLEPTSYDLVHTRNVLMHVDGADRIIAQIVGALRPGGRLLLEEADYYALAGVTSEVFARVASPLVARWTWARTMPLTLSRLPVVDLRVMIDASMLQGASEEAAFWAHTIWSARDRIIGAAGEASAGSAVTEDEISQVLTLLADPTFWTPFASVICVTAQLPER
jgi:SAM-dependent methyltransferase